MKAMVQRVYGGPENLRLEELDRPTPGQGEVLVAVHAAGVNWADYSILTGVPYMVRLGFGVRAPRHGIRGTDVSGVVVSSGPGVRDIRPGDEMFGWCKAAFAEFVSVPGGQLVAKPEAISFEQAAAVPMAGMVALQALRDIARLRSGQEVLVVGASGGIGTFAVQIAKAMGAEVTGVCSTAHVDLVRGIGADHVIDYTIDDFTRSEERYDVILDIADNHSLAARRRVLKPGGTLIPNSGEGNRLVGSLGRIVGARLLSPFVSQRLRPFLSMASRDDLEALRDLIESRQVVPVVGRTYPLVEAAAALDHVGRRHSRGKTVLSIT
ncbi:MAG TPA: NAD(P)-dependent alcohol dehydrogenase [Acidimicrobiia bacterium]|nr:NAD(P)-dependent alcohol dehydrogenase [Acidimicrobiia bacterium]